MAILETFPSRDNSHTILNDSGTAVAKEDNLQFVGFDVTDDSTNNKTKVKAVGLNSDSLDDVCSGEISSAFAQTGLCYSTNEQIVGKWVDGRPIYQRTWNGSFALSTNAVVIDSIQVSDARTMIGVELVSDDGVVGDRYMFTPKEAGWSGQRKLRLSISSGSYTMTSITLRYTKD